MLTSAIPSRLQKAFAESGIKNAIPTASQIGITLGAASLTDGFPPLTMTPIAAGGVPPFGADMNGILNLLSSHLRWMNAGGTYTWDSTFQTAIGGYPKCAMVQKADNSGWWISTVDGNTSNPDTGGAGWVEFTPQGGAQSFGLNGYKKLPGGLIFQWGTVSSIVTSGDSTQAITYPISFPNAVYGVYGNFISGAASQNMGCYVNPSPGLSGATFVIDKNNTESFGIGLNWFALGS